MKEMQVNPRMITIAMVARGLTQQQLSDKLEVTQGALSRWINGDLSVKQNNLEKLAEVLGYPVHFFGEDIRVLPRYLVYYRRKSSIGQGELNKIHYNLYIQKHALKKLLESIDIPSNPLYLNPDINGSPDKIAQYVRQRWKVPRGPIKNLVNLVENAGIFVLWLDLDTDGYDGQVLPDEDGLPVIVLNKNMPADKQRFTLAHELGHLVMHTADFMPEEDQNYEKQAHQFAGELLMPKSDILPDFSESTGFQRIAGLKPYWKVSISALVRRAYETGAINHSRYTSLNVQLSREGMRKNEPQYGISTEKPTLFKQVMDAYLNDLDYSQEQLAYKMCVTVEEFRQIYDTYSDRQMRFKIIRNTD